MQPRAVLRRQVRHELDRVKIPRIHLACIRHEYRRPVQLPQPTLERIGVEAACRVASEALDISLAHAKHPDRLQSARMDVATRENRWRRELGQPALLYVHTVLLSPPVARGGERD